MTAPLIRIGLRTFILILSGLIGLHSVLASDELTPSSRVSSVRISLASYERIPISALLAHPDRYQMREVRLTGTVTAIQTAVIASLWTCGRAYEQTMLTLEDDSGQIEVIDQGTCGKNVGALKTPMLKAGQQIDLLILINTPTGSGASASALEAMVRYLDLVR